MRSRDSVKTTLMMRSVTTANAINNQRSFEILTKPQTYLNAFKYCRKESIWKASVQLFERDRLKECINLANEVKAGTYKTHRYLEFDIYERGKPRHIKAPAIRDRVFCHALCNQILMPRILPTLIYDNSAAIKNRGVSFARKRVLTHLHRYYTEHKTNEGYILQTDFSSFFNSIDHELLYQAFCKFAPEPEIRKIIKDVIDTFDTNTGIGIGSELSQVAGIMYPAPIDNYCKIVARCRYYARYMDDIYIIHQSKDFLQNLFIKMQEIAETLKLKFNPRKCHISKINTGFCYLKGTYKLTKTGKVLYSPCRISLVRERRKLKRMHHLFKSGALSLNDVKTCYKSWRGNLIRQYPQMSKKTLANFDNLYSKLYGELQ